MTRMVAGMIMSLDGFIQGCAGSVAALYPDLDTLVKTKAFGGKRSPKLAAAAVRGRSSGAGKSEGYTWGASVMHPLFWVVKSIGE